MSRVLRVATLVAFGLGGWSVGAVAAAGSAAACEINPGPGSCPPDALTVGPTATVIATQHHTVTAAEGSGKTLTATYTENVYRDPSNKYCANCLVYVVQVFNDNSGQNGPPSTDFIEHVTVNDFSGSFVDIGVSTNGAPGMTDNGTGAPVQVDRSGDGSVITWDFTGSSANELQPGQTTKLLEVITNDSSYKPGSVGILDGAGLFAPGFEPQVPEAIWVPAFTLLGGMMVGGVALRRRHNRAKDEASQSS